MSRQKSTEVEQHLYFLTEQMVQVRADMQHGIIDSTHGVDRLGILAQEYTQLKNSAENWEQADDADEEEDDLKSWDDMTEAEKLGIYES